MSKKHTHIRLSVLIKLIGFFFFLFLFLRLGFILSFYKQAPSFSLSDITQAVFIGLRFDLRLSVLLILPLMLSIPFKALANNERYKQAMSALYVALLTGTIIFYLIDFAYYAYLKSRINATIFQFAKNPILSFQMAWQTYPLFWYSLGLILFAIALYYFFKRFVFNYKPVSPLKTSYSKSIFLGIVFFFSSALAIHGQLSQYPLRWSNAFFNKNTFISAAGLNPILYLNDTMRFSEKPYHEKSIIRSAPFINQYLDLENTALPTKLDAVSFRRPVKMTPLKSLNGKQPNIVIIVMESLSYFKTSVGGHPLDTTPYLKEIADQSTSFTNYYTPTEGTARSFFCLVSGIADVHPNKGTSSRNSLIVKQNTPFNAFTQHNKFYFIGGSASWANIRGVFGNINNIKMYEQDDYKSSTTDVWGVSDFDLFSEAHGILEKRAEQEKPFVAVIQTAGFHRPYTIARNDGGFKVLKNNEKEVKQTGFVSLDEFNSLRFSDYSLGHFMKLAKKSNYFDNTIFVITGDHGLPDQNAKQLPPGVSYHHLERFHVPLLFYSPKYMPKEVRTQMASEPDILPTISGITNNPFEINTLGTNLFSVKNEEDRMSFVYIYYATPTQVGAIKDNFYIAGTPGEDFALYDYLSKQPSIDVQDQHPVLFKKMKNFAEAYYYSSQYLLYNNK